MDKLTAEGKKIINQEAQALRQLAQLLSTSFSQAIKSINSCRGKIVISGIGKAGIIGKKIAATFSSLGSSSFFMHPAEAAHGDFGMLTARDIIILISNSGSSAEITSLIPSIKTLGCKLLAITGNPDSELGKQADILLNIGKIKEACYLGLAPTSSTTAILALGDALAVVSMNHKKNFDKNKYAFYHPGGDLGKKLLKTREVMRTGDDIVIAHHDDLLKNILINITRARTGCAVIVDSQKILNGIFTDGDLRKNLEKNQNILEKKISSFMTGNPKSIRDDAYALEALKLMKDYMIGDLPVTDEGNKVCGIISMKDLINIGLV
ncbi:MAG TPA: KpsF/GutQ family sugar-phosphate isomerase [Spirochaetota bacterium]|nr:KpsF/GutQ family sugar-phosphate isomerase [Spirochaetota bacterium]